MNNDLNLQFKSKYGNEFVEWLKALVESFSQSLSLTIIYDQDGIAAYDKAMAELEGYLETIVQGLGGVAKLEPVDRYQLLAAIKNAVLRMLGGFSAGELITIDEEKSQMDNTLTLELAINTNIY